MNSIQILHQNAVKAINQRNYVEAHKYCVDIVKIEPEHADAYFLLGIINSEIGQINKAIKLIKKAISFRPQVEYFAHLAKCYSLTGNMQAALEAVKQAPVNEISHSLTLDTIGVALSRVGLHTEALSYFRKAIELEPNTAGYFYNFAVSSKFAGEFEQARGAFEKAITLKPDYFQAHFALSDLVGVTSGKNNIVRLKQQLSQTSNPDACLHLGHALAKELEALGNFDEAFDILTQVKRQKLDAISYNISEDKRIFEATLNTQRTLKVGNRGCLSNKPIFVVGMPRSGTTLVERIISNHSDVKSCGELQDFGVAVKELTNTPSPYVLDVDTLKASQALDFEKLGSRYLERVSAISGEEKHFIDKLPFNFFYIGLIRRALPNAKIICLLRDPMDTCIGNFRQLFSINSPYYSYAYDLNNIGYFYAEFYKLAKYWHTVNTDNFLLLDYQKLVADPNKQVRELIGFCGLDWQPQCLHAERNTAPVSTASKVQVREPINGKSIGRWLKFKSHTNELQAYLTEQGIPII